MIFFRILSFVVGLFVLLASFSQLLPEADYRPFAGPNTALYISAAILAFSAFYFFIAVSARRTARSRTRRLGAAILTAMQVGAGAWIVEFFPEPYLIGVIGFLLCFTVLLFTLFVLPRKGRHSYKYLRRQDERRAAPAKTGTM